MKLKKVLFFTFCLLMGLGANARSLSDFDLAAYQTSKALCAPLVEKGGLSQSFSNFHLYVLTSSLKETDAHLAKMATGVVSSRQRQLITDYKTVGALGDLLHSEGFMQAMRECFPNEADHHRFVLTLIVAEKLGNFVVMASTAMGISWSLRYLALKFPTVFNLANLKYFLKITLKISVLSSPLALSASVDQDSRESTKKESLDQQISHLQIQLQSNNLNDSEKKQINIELRSLLLHKVLEGLN